MYVVTGGLGFIGSHIVRALAKRGEKVIIVEDLQKCANKIANISDCAYAVVDMIDITTFFSNMLPILKNSNVTGIFHEGACVNTKETDFKHMTLHNTEFTRALIETAITLSIKIVYASSAAVYGTHSCFCETPTDERPANGYALSKLIIDNMVRALPKDQPLDKTIVGLRYFNVYGSNEDHKGTMASMVHQIAKKMMHDDEVDLFKSYTQLGFSRDFVHVDDVVKVNMHFMFSDKTYRGVFNVGTGQDNSFESVAMFISKVLHSRSKIREIPIPTDIVHFYQPITKANLTNLRSKGDYNERFISINEGIEKLYGAKNANF